MRSSIACVRCRRSKVKCINNGPGSICRSCEISGRECTYPLPAVGNGAAAKRDQADALHRGATTNALPSVQGDEAPKRRRLRKASTVPTAASATTAQLALQAATDLLESPYLTAQVWVEIFDIFQLHFSADLPFLHPPTFLDHFRQPATSAPHLNITTTNQYSQNSRPSASPLVLLSLLALTARFHPGICAYHAHISFNRLSRPIAVSDYYAKHSRELLTSSHSEEAGYPSLERIQALLMLGLHEWSMCRGVKAWIYVGLAVRMAQLKGLQFEEDLEDEPKPFSNALQAEAQHLGVSTSQEALQSAEPPLGPKHFIDKEVRRRTFWGCFLLDRYMSSGKYRPQMLDLNELRVQLPASQRAFVFGEHVRTRLLSEELMEWSFKSEAQDQRAMDSKQSRGDVDPVTKTQQMFRRDETIADTRSQAVDGRTSQKWEVGQNEGTISRVVKIIEIWGRMAKWSCRGGRRTEHFPPWDPRSTFSSLRQLLTQFYNDLPPTLYFNHANLSAHITSRTSTPYTLMHTVYLLCLIILHREYVPFIPIRCAKPQGPLDEPTFPPDRYDIPPGWWELSAKECFKAARDIMDMIRTCQEWGVLAETPLIGFAIYTVAFVGVYCINFPQMDPDGFMCSNELIDDEAAKRQNSKPSNSKGADSARLAIEIIGRMRSRLKMADGWLRTVKRMHHYFRKMKEDCHNNSKAISSSMDPRLRDDSQRHLSIREGGGGGGLAEYKLLEKTLKEFGSLEDDEISEVGEADRNTNVPTPILHQPNDYRGANPNKSETTTNNNPSPAPKIAPWQENFPPQGDLSPVVASGPEEPPSSAAAAYDPMGVAGFQRAIPADQPPPAGISTSYYPQLSQHMPPSIPSQQSTFPGPVNVTAEEIVTPGHPATASSLIQSPFGNSDIQPYPGPYAPPPVPPPSMMQNYPSSDQQPVQVSQQVSTPAPLLGQSLSGPDPAESAWNAEAKKEWLDNLDTRLGGDDVAAFVDGSSCEEWGLAAGSGQGGSGWLSTVWGGAGGF